MSPSAFETLVRSRVSLRRYSERAVPDDVILSVVDAARRAPSASNGQPWRFIAVAGGPAREALAQACFTGLFSATRFAAKAPLIVALCAERAGLLRAAHALKDSAMYQLDCGIAGEHLVLRAAELGLGSCWIGWFPRRRARRVLGAPPHVKVVSLLAIGYPPDDWTRPVRPRRKLSEILWRDRWGVEFPGSSDLPVPDSAEVRKKG